MGYAHKKTKEGSSPTTLKSDKNPKSYVVSLKRSLKKKVNNNKHILININLFIFLRKMNIEERKIQEDSPNELSTSFLGYCFSCNNFVHKGINCRAYGKNTHKRNRNSQSTSKCDCMNNNTSGDRNYNSIDTLEKYIIECYRCNNFGQKSCDCKLIKYSIKESTPLIQK